MAEETNVKGILSGRSILIVEDEALLALDLHQTLREAGASLLAAISLEDALELLPYAQIDAAVLDINLGGPDCAAVCSALSRRSIPFIFYTAEAKAEIVGAWPNAPVVLKPEPPERRIVDLLAALVSTAKTTS
jgi:CheY-like chemotaxis protein